MKRSAIACLTDPESQRPLSVMESEDHNDEVQTATLSDGNGASFALSGGIPSFVPASVTQTQTVQSFAQKWEKHTHYREHTGEFYTKWFLERYGLSDLDGLRAVLADTTYILDAGTGSGRDALMFAENSSANVFGVDTARAALDQVKGEVDHPHVSLVHADLNSMPFPDGFFDFISCDQVIHHTANPRATFEVLRQKLRPGGQICCYVYRKKAAIREFTDDYVRDRIRDLPIDQAMQVCEGITQLGRTLADLNVTIDIAQDIPVLGIKKGKQDLQRFIHWNVMKCFWNDDFDEFTNRIINYDWYHPENCFRFSPEEFREWFDTGWEVQSWDVQEAGISCRARKI